jgi:N-acetylglucosamine-6-phosphate deacetylase
VNDSVVAIDAGTVLSPFEEFKPGRVILRGQTIEAVGKTSDVAIPQQATRIQAAAFTLTPGFIDPHVHGSAGADVMDATSASMNTISANLSRHGTTSFLATTVSLPPTELTTAITRLGKIIGNTYAGAIPLGLHLEGPFINAARRGTHEATHVHKPDLHLLDEWVNASSGSLRLITVAPELEGALDVVRSAHREHIRVAMGHSDAGFEEAAAASDLGVHYAVHTFNAMRPFMHRDPGILGVALGDDRVYAEIITDGIHVSPEVLPIFMRLKGVRRFLLVTDAISATGMPDGEFKLGGKSVQVNRGVCRDAEGRLAGSTLTQDAALRNLLQWTSLSLQEAILGLTANPADALGLGPLGRIEAGAPADLVLLDNERRVHKTFVRGNLVFERQFQAEEP